MEAAKADWTGDRLDEFARRVDDRFDGIDDRFDRIDERFDRVDERFADADRRTTDLVIDSNRRFGEITSRLDAQGQRLDLLVDSLGSVRNSIVFGVVTLTAGFMAGFAAIIALIATQL